MVKTLKPDRTRLPNRRTTFTVSILIGRDHMANRDVWRVSDGKEPEWEVTSRWEVSLSPDASGRIKEIFVYGTKGALKGLTDHSCIMMSLLLQHGYTPKDIIATIGAEDGQPASILVIVAEVAALMERELGIDKAAE